MSSTVKDRHSGHDKILSYHMASQWTSNSLIKASCVSDYLWDLQQPQDRRKRAEDAYHSHARWSNHGVSPKSA